MSAAALIAQVGELLEEEREAIKRIDGVRVEAIAYEKLALVQELQTLSDAERSAVAPQLRAMVADLQRNGVLLVQAHAILAGIRRLRTQGGASGATLLRGGRGNTSPDPVQISVRG